MTADKQPTDLVATEQSPLAIMAQGVAAGTATAEAAQILQQMLYAEQDRQARLAYFEALSAFQSECPEITRTKKAGNYKYAPLEDVIRQVGPTLRAHAFSFRFVTEPQEGGVLVTCHLTHREGHTEATPVWVPAAKLRGGGSDTQETGATIAYGKRYSFLGATGIMTADEDTDGRRQEPPSDPVTADQAANLQTLAEEVGADAVRFLKWAKADDWSGIRAASYENCVRALEEKRRQAQ